MNDNEPVSGGPGSPSPSPASGGASGSPTGPGPGASSAPSGSGAGGFPSPAAPSPPPSSASAPAASPQAQGAPQSAAATGTAGQAQPFSLREQLRSHGIDPSRFQDDTQAWQALHGEIVQTQQRLQQAEQVAAAGRYYLANKAAIDQVMQQRQAPQQGQAPAWPGAQPAAGPAQPSAQGGAQQDWWKAPQWDKSWENFLTKDAQGNIVAVPGADPGLPLKYQEYKRWQAETLERFLANPVEAIKPGLEQMFQKQMEQVAQQQYRQQQEQQFARNYIQQAAPLFYQLDARGQPIINPYSGTPQLSPLGQKFGQYVQQLEAAGIKDVVMLQQISQGLLERDAYAAQAANQQQPSQQPAANPASAANQQLKTQALQAGMGQNAIAARHPAANPPAQEPARPGAPSRRRRFGERLTEAFQANGLMN